MDDENEVIETPEVPVEPETPVETVEEEGALVVQIGDEEPEVEPEQAPEWVRDLRKRDRENQKRIKELEAQLNKPVDVVALPAKPKLDDFDYDTDAFETALESWYDAKREHDQREQAAQREQEQAQQSWQAKVSSYNEAKVKAPYADFDEAEAFVTDTFDITQQGLLIKVAKDAPTLVYALGKNPKKAAELAAIKDYAEFVAEAVRVEMNVKTSRKPATSPEKTVTVPTVPGVSSTDNTLERLREDAAKTGDFSKVMAYKRSMRA